MCYISCIVKLKELPMRQDIKAYVAGKVDRMVSQIMHVMTIGTKYVTMVNIATGKIERETLAEFAQRM